MQPSRTAPIAAEYSPVDGPRVSMSSEDGFVAADINEYIAAMSPAEDPDREGLRLATVDLPRARMQISPGQGRLMALLTRLLGARRAIEVGVFTGYSAL